MSQDAEKLNRAQKIEMYRRLAAGGVGARQPDCVDDLMLAIKSFDVEMLDALHGLGVDITEIVGPEHDDDRDEYDRYDRYGWQDREPEKKRYNLLLMAVRDRNMDALEYVFAKKLQEKYKPTDHAQAFTFHSEDMAMTEYLLSHGLKPGHNIFKTGLAEQRSVAHMKLFIDYGYPLNYARDALRNLVTKNEHPPGYVAAIANMLKLPPAKKPMLTASVSTFPIEVEAPDAPRPSPDEVVITRNFLGNRRIMHVFNFVTRERTSAVRRDDFAPIESIESKQFCELRDHPDLLDAHAEHRARGGRVTREDLYRPVSAAPYKVVPPL